MIAIRGSVSKRVLETPRVASALIRRDALSADDPSSIDCDCIPSLHRMVRPAASNQLGGWSNVLQVSAVYLDTMSSESLLSLN